MTALQLLAADFGGFWSLVTHSGPVAQLVLLVLAAFSIFSWTIMVQKYRLYRKVEEQSTEFHEAFQNSLSLSEIYKVCDNFPYSPLAGIFRRGYMELMMRVEAVNGHGPAAEEAQREAVLRGLPALQRTLQKAAMAEMLSLERSLNWLGTTGAVTPFIGLFGTVIGIIDAFRGLGEGGPTTIQAVAPGISEALVATAAGLFAAVPAVIGYNHFIARLRQFGAEMDDFAAEFMNLVERSFG
ncbi:MAG TPA: MotA/TolQ/ExbB proton channel family protein [Acidobacteriota bacterium]|nr:MotA/TolQ/ExbB proton channel family protein [Acidobacteriota bacterium]HRR27558.1 MotA/TolQ/ExbB proton channel family protein [Acidobacteriota bacterium]HRR56497.1 MotA/TolQ/ExbB proton channel family protein [Acidobacteriota bacterium]HRV07003.1 MotA/TolQ/ExbB proton channel family protein [Acidobacteriota bacterium]